MGIEYEGGVLAQAAVTAVNLTHRVGAVITFFIVGGLALKLFTLGTSIAKRFALAPPLDIGALSVHAKLERSHEDIGLRSA